jgi:hypothetical protein
MKKLMFSLSIFFLLTFLSAPSFAARRARIKCLVKPPQAGAYPPFKTNWNGVVKRRVSVAGKGRWVKEPFVVAPDGFIERWFERPSKKGIELQASIRIRGGHAYKDSWITLWWEGGRSEPEVYIGKRAEVERLKPYDDVVQYGAIFRMIRE